MEIKTYENGLEDAWEAAKNIFLGLDEGGFTRNQLYEIFGMKDEYSILKNTSAREAVNKINAWKKSHYFDVGYVVDFNIYQKLGVVLEVRNDKLRVLWEDLRPDFCSMQDVTWTGRVIDIKKLLSEIKGE